MFGNSKNRVLPYVLRAIFGSNKIETVQLSRNVIEGDKYTMQSAAHAVPNEQQADCRVNTAVLQDNAFEANTFQHVPHVLKQKVRHSSIVTPLDEICRNPPWEIALGLYIKVECKHESMISSVPHSP